jgi:hypothetical protein
MMEIAIIDAHAHCGIQDQSVPQAFEDYLSHVRGSDIEGVVMFPPVMEIYDRYNPDFVDDAGWQQRRRHANDYLLNLGNNDLEVFPYLFIWNDFAVEQLSSQHRGIKWHRHAYEPVYHYDDPRCRKAVEKIRQRKMPVVFEEELKNTVRFINEIAKGVSVIIPHLGFLNGGYLAISKHGLWKQPNVFTDTSLASSYEITDYIQTYGHERMIFGSDFPFGDPKEELFKIQRLQISEEKKRAILGLNVKRLLAGGNTPRSRAGL